MRRFPLPSYLKKLEINGQRKLSLAMTGLVVLICLPWAFVSDIALDLAFFSIPFSVFFVTVLGPLILLFCLLIYVKRAEAFDRRSEYTEPEG